MYDRIAEGRTDLAIDLVALGTNPNAADAGGVTLMQWCAYYGDVGTLRFLESRGASLQSLGDNLDLNGAAFHGHWQLCEFLLERGADPNRPMPDTGETPLHSAVCKPNRPWMNRVVAVLLAHRADPNLKTTPGIATGAFMRDCRTKGETSLHRAAAFGDEETVRSLLDAGGDRTARDAFGDTPLSWASWYNRPNAILRKLCYGEYRIHPNAP
jgi:ankyrin repeat protein